MRTSKSGRNVSYTTRLKPLTNQEKGNQMSKELIVIKPSKLRAAINRMNKEQLAEFTDGAVFLIDDVDTNWDIMEKFAKIMNEREPDES